MFTGRAGEHVVIVNWRDALRPPSEGSHVYCTEVARHLVSRGLRVTLLQSGSPTSDPAPDGVTVVELGRGGGRYRALLAWLRTHRREIDAVLDCQNGVPSFSPLALPRGIPVTLLALHVHQQQYHADRRWPFGPAGRWLEGAGTRLVYASRPVCAVSPSARSEVRRALRLRGRAFVVPAGQSTAEREAPARSERPRIVCVGRLLSHKRWHLLIEAMQDVALTHPGVELHLVGEGPEHDALDELVTRLGLGDRVVLHGRLDDAVRDELLGSAWLTASASEREGLGLTLLEAASLGVPALAFDTPGLRDAVRHGDTGWLVGEGEDLAAALVVALKTLDDDDVAAEHAARCREWARSFTWTGAAERLVAVLRSEARRVRLGPLDNRIRNDVATLVHLPASVVRDLPLRRGLRGTDQVVEHAGGDMRVLLGGADEADSVLALDRLGISSKPGQVRIGLARHRDLIGWPQADRMIAAVAPDDRGAG